MRFSRMVRMMPTKLALRCRNCALVSFSPVSTPYSSRRYTAKFRCSMASIMSR